MSTQGIKAKGTAAESVIVGLLRRSGWPHAERRALNGSTDRGDIAGVPSVVFESKSGARITLPDWLRETEVERVNDKAAYGVLVVKLKGYGEARIEEWPAVLPLGQLLRLLNEAGYGTEVPDDQLHADALAEAETLRQELEALRGVEAKLGVAEAELARSEAVCATAMAEVEALTEERDALLEAAKAVRELWRYDAMGAAAPEIWAFITKVDALSTKDGA